MNTTLRRMLPKRNFKTPCGTLSTSPLACFFDRPKPPWVVSIPSGELT